LKAIKLNIIKLLANKNLEAGKSKNKLFLAVAKYRIPKDFSLQFHETKDSKFYQLDQHVEKSKKLEKAFH